MNEDSSRLQQLADRLQAIPPARPSQNARTRGWNLLSAQLDQSATIAAPRPARRLVGAFAGVLALVALVGLGTAAADSLPDSPLYAIKGLEEGVRGAFIFSPGDRLAFHLHLAELRLHEAEAMLARHEVSLGVQALEAADLENAAATDVVNALHAQQPLLAASLGQRLREAIRLDDRRLDRLQVMVEDPAALGAIQTVRDHANQRLRILTSSPTPNPSPSLSPAESPTGSASESPAASVTPSGTSLP